MPLATKGPRHEPKYRTHPPRPAAGAAAGGAAVVSGELAEADEKPQDKGGLPQVKPKEIDVDARRLQAAYDLMQEWTAGKKAPVPGGAILVGRSGKTLAPRYFGKQGRLL